LKYIVYDNKVYSIIYEYRKGFILICPRPQSPLESMMLKVRRYRRVWGPNIFSLPRWELRCGEIREFRGKDAQSLIVWNSIKRLTYLHNFTELTILLNQHLYSPFYNAINKL